RLTPRASATANPRSANVTNGPLDSFKIPHQSWMNDVRRWPCVLGSTTKNPPVTNHWPIVNQLWHTNSTIVSTGETARSTTRDAASFAGTPRRQSAIAANITVAPATSQASYRVRHASTRHHPAVFGFPLAPLATQSYVKLTANSVNANRSGSVIG